MLLGKVSMELLGEVPVYLAMGIKVFSAVVLGGMVGFDREKKMKAAGLKTNILICLGATLYTTVGLSHFTTMGPPMGDPNRVGAQIVSGIGFLGAGAIIQARGSVIGMTTAATIWVVAAIGFTIGNGFPFSAAIFSITVLVVLKWINPFYRLLEKKGGKKAYLIEVLSFGPVKRSILAIAQQESVIFDQAFEDRIDKKRAMLGLHVNAHPRAMERMMSEIKKLASVERVSYHELEEGQRLDEKADLVDFVAKK